MSIRKNEAIQFPDAYPNMFVQPLESFLVNGSVEYNTDILSLSQEEKEWVGNWALTEIFDMVAGKSKLQKIQGDFKQVFDGIKVTFKNWYISFRGGAIGAMKNTI